MENPTTSGRRPSNRRFGESHWRAVLFGCFQRLTKRYDTATSNVNRTVAISSGGNSGTAPVEVVVVTVVVEDTVVVNVAAVVEVAKTVEVKVVVVENVEVTTAVVVKVDVTVAAGVVVTAVEELVEVEVVEPVDVVVEDVVVDGCVGPVKE